MLVRYPPPSSPLARVGTCSSSRVAERARCTLERAHSQEELRQRTEQFEAFIHQAPMGIYMVDDEFRIRLVNLRRRRSSETRPTSLGETSIKSLIRSGRQSTPTSR